MSIRIELENMIFEMELVTKAFGLEPFAIYFLGGSACILGGYSERATKDFDFIDLDYSSKLGKAFTLLREYDMLVYELSILSPHYKKRAKKLEKFKYLNIYVLSKEDIIVSKVIRLEDKDLEDIDILIKSADRKLIKQIIEEVLDREDLNEMKRKGFLEKLPLFEERYLCIE